MAILRLLSRFPDGLGVSAVANTTSIPLASAHRLLQALLEEGMVRKHRGRYIAADNTAAITIDRRERRIRVVARPWILELYNRSRHPVSLAVEAGRMARYIDSLYPKSLTDVILATSPEAPLHCTAVGKTLLAHSPPLASEYLSQNRLHSLTNHSITRPELLESALAQVRLRGFAVEFGEHVTGFASVSVPVLSASGTAYAAVSVAGPVRSFQPAPFIDVLRHTATNMAATLN
ncbi:IclR family transcriptional regulator [Salininema proteolyticum]|uniref:IclR family transcriptional regulator n=1 Tax=Salininema proteolyticum TaxID=1607685 RepID=A0ABV8U159_9ACTN